MAKKHDRSAHYREAIKRQRVAQRQNALVLTRRAQEAARDKQDQKPPRERLEVGRRRVVAEPRLVAMPHHLAGMRDSLDTVELAAQLRNDAEETLGRAVQRARWMHESWRDIGALTGLTSDGARSKWGRAWS